MSLIFGQLRLEQLAEIKFELSNLHKTNLMLGSADWLKDCVRRKFH
jgi:hypothetical protein